MSIGEIDALHMDGDVKYISHREHAKFFAVRKNGDMYYHHRGDYLFLEDGLKSWFDQGL